MSSKFETILNTVAAELEPFVFASVVVGTVLDGASALPSCLVSPQKMEREEYSLFGDTMRYTVVLTICTGERNSADAFIGALQTAENIQKHFHHKRLGAVAGHLDTVASVESLGGKDGLRVCLGLSASEEI